ncbi:T9SS type A sorting domain-containing protein [Spirosoma sp. KUDC1026]|uniref:Ig-like domain-containing protein n=1 Tax=Spirosoma sp. KUDC1026 TaxID=2745947 RepID=UPI00159BC028|nr:T9SS type A sorting domain-containing protein [Spirosoma sp. KUDC1026]QKZ12083.1 T9SS type A sorting domain-containing protein [Spirosoma sp. KUDC1026]
MTIHINRYWLVSLLLLVCLSTTQAQVTLNLYYGDPAASPDAAFDGNVFQAGTQFGDAPFFVKFSGTGTRYFEIDSPGETGTNALKKVSNDGFVIIRPVASMVIDQSKIKNFTGTVVGSVAITVKPLSITTISSNVTETSPGAELTVSYRTGAGTFPVELAESKFKVQLLSADGLTVLGDLLNSTDQYSGREQKGASFGGTRSIKATIPTSTTAGTYRVRVITQGLIANVAGSASSQFTVRANQPVTTAISTTALTGNFCAGSVVSFPFSTTGTFPTGNTFKVQLVNTDGSLLQDLAGTGTTSPISATLPASVTAGTYRFRVSATATNVVSNTASVSVIAQPTLTISGSSTVTAGSTAPVQLAFTGTAPWSFTYVDNGTLRSSTSSVSSTTISPTFSAATIFDKSFIRGFRDSGCGISDNISGSTQISIRQNQITTLTTGPLSGTYCPGLPISVSFTTSTTLPAGLTYQVQLSDAAGTFNNAVTIGTGSASPMTATLPTSISAGTGYRVQVVVQKPTTTGATDYSTLTSPVSTSIAISRPDAPRVADVAFCSSTTLTSPLSATGTNLKWYDTATTSLSLTGAPTPSSTQARTYYVSQTVNGCESMRAAINVTPNTGPAAPAASSVSLCQGTQGQFSTTVSNPLWYTVVTGGTSSTLAPTINSQTAGEQTVYVSQTIGGCESPRTAVKATIFPLPNAPTVPAQTTVCQNSTNLLPLTASGSSLSWYNQAGVKLSAAPTPSTSTTGVQSFSVTQTVNGCESPRAIVSAIVAPAPAPPITANSVGYCANQTPVSLTATGTNLRWYNQAGTALSGPPNLTNTGVGTYIFSVTQTDANNCESARQPVSVSVIAVPSAPSATSIALCQGTQGSFSTNIPNALWYTAATGGTGSLNPPTLNNQNAGEQTVYVSQTINGCESARATLRAVVYPIPAAPTVPAQTTVCQNSTSTALSATSTTPGALFTWYDQTNTKSSVAPTPITSGTGVQSFSVTQTVNTCESPRATVSVFVRAAPAPPVAASVRYCLNEPVQPLSVTAVSGFTVKWYTTPVGGSPTASNPAYSTTSANTYTFYVTQTDANNCESTRQSVSVVVVNPPSVPGVNANQLFCQNARADTLTASPNVGLLWEGPGITGTSTVAPVPSTSSDGSFIYSVYQRAGNCVSPKAQIVVRIVPTPAAPTVKATVQYCIGVSSTALSATGATGNRLLWYRSADPGGQAESQIVPNISQAGRTTYYVTQKNADNCESQRSSIEVRVSNQPTATLSGDESVYPGDSTAIRVRLTGDGPWSFRFNNILYTATDSLKVIWVRPPATSQQVETYTVTNLTTECGTSPASAIYRLRVLSPLGTQPSVEPISVKAYPNPTTGDVSVDWSSPTRQAVTFQILNAAGTVVRQVTRQASTTPQTEHFQLGTQPAGTYFLKVQTESNGVQGKSIIKQ